MKRAILLLLFPLLTLADPSPATQYLLDEPASLMDVGIIRLATALRLNSDIVNTHYYFATDNEDILVFTSVNYSLADDKINVRIFIDLRDGDRAESGCRNTVTKLTPQIKYFVGRLFSHSGFEDLGRQADFADQLFGRTDIYCGVRTIIPQVTLVTVRKNLTSDEIDVIDWDGE